MKKLFFGHQFATGYYIQGRCFFYTHYGRGMKKTQTPIIKNVRKNELQSRIICTISTNRIVCSEDFFVHQLALVVTLVGSSAFTILDFS